MTVPFGSVPAADRRHGRSRFYQRLVAPPEVEEPVLPLVPELLLVPAEPPPVDGEVAVEPPEAPMPELVPEDEELGVELADEPPEAPMPDEVPEAELGRVVAVAEPEGVDIEPVAEPPVDPMPDAVPDALPEAVEPQAARAAVQARARMVFIMDYSCVAGTAEKCAAPAHRVQRNAGWEKRPRTRPGVGGWAAAASEDAYGWSGPGRPERDPMNSRAVASAELIAWCMSR